MLEKESESEERRGAGEIAEQTQVVVSLRAFHNRFVWSPLFGLPGSKVPQPHVACLARRTETVSPALVDQAKVKTPTLNINNTVRKEKVSEIEFKKCLPGMLALVREQKPDVLFLVEVTQAKHRNPSWSSS